MVWDPERSGITRRVRRTFDESDLDMNQPDPLNIVAAG
jgi:hypothetical protein